MRHDAGLAILALLLGIAVLAIRGWLRDRRRRRRDARLGMKIGLIRSSRD
jgi:Tfp pilus assembly protein FimT